MNAAAHIGQSVAYSHMLAGTGLPMDAAHATFEGALLEEEPALVDTGREATVAEKRAALKATMVARGEDRATAAMAGIQ